MFPSVLQYGFINLSLVNPLRVPSLKETDWPSRRPSVVLISLTWFGASYPLPPICAGILSLRVTCPCSSGISKWKSCSAMHRGVPCIAECHACRLTDRPMLNQVLCFLGFIYPRSFLGFSKSKFMS